MLVLSRRESEQIKLGDSIVVTVVKVAGDRVRLGIEAPSDVLVLRGELERRSGEQPCRCALGVNGTRARTAHAACTTSGRCLTARRPAASSPGQSNSPRPTHGCRGRLCILMGSASFCYQARGRTAPVKPL